MFIRICAASEVLEGELYRFEVDSKTLLVVRRGVKFVATSATCTHEEADLTLGIFTGKTITCPLHQAKFDLETGSVLKGPNNDSASSISSLKVYDIKVQNGDLFADI
ncbi:MAG: Rieske 2Fe-2S domain-containing protein [Nitrososphaerota archaeon]|nr:Rieske 2Fe-2S domain-containing protein [Nitrososphaerota archaeon]